MDGLADVAIKAGRIAEVRPFIPAESARQVVDVAGKLVTPGLIDVHVHVYPGVASELSLDADEYCLPNGVTTVTDAGSAGAYTIGGLRRYVIEPSRTRILAWLHISSIGMISNGLSLPELGWLPLANVDRCVKAAEENRDILVGIKVRLSRFVVRDVGIAPFYLALEAAERAGMPLMVHVGDTPAPLTEILDHMRPGDVLTHTYQAVGGHEILDGGKSFRYKPTLVKGASTTLLDADGKVIPAAWAARERGVLMDVGHGSNSFSFDVFRPAFAQGFPPDTIGSDLHQMSVNGPVFSLLSVMSRILCMGMSLCDVIAATTIRPAKYLGLAPEIGSLRPGACADVAVLELRRGEFEYRDGSSNALRGEWQLFPHLTVRAGQTIAPPQAPASSAAAAQKG
jgi:dihydroorotase